ncbi:MAG: M14 family zinc carboxypeptidase [Candidatus Sumerlaeia bacterium]|nr:M14 family zinc carboxypeptidase [Candidatus Sumerlaeia bacterium]
MKKFATTSFVAMVCLLAINAAQAHLSCEQNIYTAPLLFVEKEEELAQKAPGTLPQKITVAVNGITFDSNYDNGSLAAVALGTPVSGREVYNMNIFTENGELGTAAYWFRFTMDGVAGRALRLNIDHTQNLRPVVRFFSTASGTWSAWRRTTSTEAPTTSRLDFNPTADQDLMEVAFFFPLGLQETYDRVNALVSGSPHATSSILPTQSFQGNDFMRVTINDVAFPDTQKHGVWVHSRAHAGEVTSTWCLIGILDQFLANDDTGRRLRAYCRLDMLVLQNVDGVEYGYTRWDSQGVDPERWSDSSNPGVPGCLLRSPAIASQTVLKQLIDERLASSLPPEVALNLHSTQGAYADTFFFQRNLNTSPTAGQAFVGNSFRTILQNYVDALNNATPLFENADPQFSTLNLCSSTSTSRFVESYFFTERGEATMAMTHEGYFRTRGYGDFGYWTDEEYIELGRGMARALVEYFNLPPAPVTATQDWMVLY